MAKGSAKGSAFEREICKKLSLWWTGDERDDVFWRTSGSGARATTRSKKGKGTFGQHGDIQAVDPMGQPLIDFICFELKRGYGKVCAFDMIDAKKVTTQQFRKWIIQAETSAEKSGAAYWALITKRDQREIMLTIPYDLCMHIASTSNGIKNIRRISYIHAGNKDLFTAKLNEFLFHVEPKHVVKGSK